eukprot:CAMPEP_0179121054 /NCGR_PEP_ID=MMETSP0796-20121207/57069_1 /TAXON_ID=73915 /ORGANISM="Pyrodinium bahamense, Strain pbaha01" /LENGTH=145 /DNA_ID=CAMNT_0020819627 /DNA_START=20 /DNA_END=454 /DNA_ORIENTATION=-
MDESIDADKVPQGLPTVAAAEETGHGTNDREPGRRRFCERPAPQEDMDPAFPTPVCQDPADKRTGTAARKAVIACLRGQMPDFEKPVPQSTDDSGEDLWADLPVIDPEELAKYLHRAVGDDEDTEAKHVFTDGDIPPITGHRAPR